MPEVNTLYEAMYIISTTIEPDQVAQVVSRMENHVTESGGEVVGTSEFGRRKLAYKIAHQGEGIYKVLYFRGNGAVVDEIKHEFLLTEAILRGTVVLANPDCFLDAESHLILPTTGTRKPGTAAPATPPAAEAAPPAAEAEAEAAPEEPEAEAVAEAEAAPAEEPAAEAAPEAEAAVEEAPAAAAPEAEAPAAEPTTEEEPGAGNADAQSA